MTARPGWTLAPALEVLRAELDALAPDRDRSSDGTIGDPAHAARKSDHNPNRAGVVRALDADAGHGLDDALGDSLAAHLIRLGAAGTHPALGAGAYVIYEGRIYSAASSWQGVPYAGSNPHETHVHVSVASRQAGYNSTRPWGLADALGAPRTANRPQAAQRPAQPRNGALPMPPTLRRGAKGQPARNLQGLMLANGCSLRVDGAFGPVTHRELVAWQKRAGLEPDGIAGPNTWRALLGV